MGLQDHSEAKKPTHLLRRHQSVLKTGFRAWLKVWKLAISNRASGPSPVLIALLPNTPRHRGFTPPGCLGSWKQEPPAAPGSKARLLPVAKDCDA